MRKGLKLRKRKIQRLLSGFGLFLFVFFVSYSSGSSNMISSASRAEELYASIRENGYNISLTSTGHIALNLNVTPDGAVAMAKDTINVKSNAAGGYKLYASATQSGENGNKLILDGDSPISIPATSGTVSEPRQLDMNSWGFAVAGAAGFDDSYDINRPNTISKFAAIPLRGQEALIGSSNDITTEDGNSTDIYYGIKGNIALHSGIYSNSVTYSIVANSSNPEQDRHIVSSSPSITEKLEGGELLTITTGYTASAAAIIIEANNNNVAPAEVKVGGSVCSEVELSNDDGVLIITCITPPHDTGTYDIAVTIPTPLYYKEYFLDNAIEYKSLYPSMQRITISEARKLNPEETIALMDERDGKMYYVTKEADGNLWMTQNLDLDLAVGEDDVTMGTLKDGEFC